LAVPSIEQPCCSALYQDISRGAFLPNIMTANVTVGGDQSMKKMCFVQGAPAGQLALFLYPQIGGMLRI